MKTEKNMRAAISSPILDAAQSVFFSRELEQIESKLYKVKYPDLEAEFFLPNRLQLPAGVDKYTWRLFDERSKAVPMAGHEDGAPVADVDGDESSTSMMSWAAAFAYNVEEIATAAHAGMPLEQMRAEAARRRLALALNYMALLGYTKKSIYGLFNQTVSQTYTTPATGTGSSKLWSTKSADQILVDMFGMVDGIADNTLDIEGGANKALSLLVTKPNLRLISTKRLSTSVSDTTVLEFFLKQRPNVSVKGANYLPTAGSIADSRTVCYDPTQVTWLGSIPFEALPVEQKGFRFVTNCRARGGGVITPFPKSIMYGDGM